MIRAIAHIFALACLVALSVVAFLVFNLPTTSERITVLDGDTILFDDIKVRLIGLDAPETREARCTAERQAGKRAAAALRDLIKDKKVRVRMTGWKDKYRRSLAYLEFADGTDIGRKMIELGYALPYKRGDEEKSARARHWCGDNFDLVG
jgi:endonuclease YncB( thermonuclease family)